MKCLIVTNPLPFGEFYKKQEGKNAGSRIADIS